MALQLVLDKNGNYTYQDVRTSQQPITSVMILKHMKVKLKLHLQQVEQI